MAGFRSAAFWLGLSSAIAVSQGGFRTPLPNWNAGGLTPAKQGGFLTPLPNWNAGAGLPTGGVPPGGGRGSKSEIERTPHGSYIPTIRLPRDIDADTVYDDAELAALAVILIQEFYE